MPKNTTTISAIKVFKYLLLVSLLFVIVHLLIVDYVGVVDLNYATPAETLAQRFHLNREVSIPTWYSQTILLFAACLLFFISAIKRRSGERYRWHWLILGIIFTYVSIDEGSALHEIAGTPVRNSLDISEGFFYFAWIIPFLAALFVLVIIYFRFFLSLPKRTKLLFVLAFVTFVGGAAGLEGVSAYYVTQDSMLIDDGIIHLLHAIEEGLEMVGTSIFIYALLDYITQIPKKQIPGLAFTN